MSPSDGNGEASRAETILGRYHTTLHGHDDAQYQPFDNIINFRDVGVVVNRLCGTRILKERVLYRSATPDDASSRDRRRLVEDIHLAMIMDLRSRTEHQNAADKRLASSLSEEQPQAPPPVSTSTDEHLLNLPGVNRVMISLAGWSLQKLLIWRLSWVNMLKLFSFVASGYRDDAIKVYTANVMQPRGLLGLAHDTLTASTTELATILTHLAQPETYPVLIHCSQGKDRTGLVVALVLLLLSELDTATDTATAADADTNTSSVPLSVIAADYALSEQGLQVERDEWIQELSRMGLGPEFADCAPAFVEEVKQFLDQGYGGVRGYLRSLGVPDDVVSKIRELLLERPG